MPLESRSLGKLLGSHPGGFVGLSRGSLRGRGVCNYVDLDVGPHEGEYIAYKHICKPFFSVLTMQPRIVAGVPFSCITVL
jgi:hypothetical protein